MAGIPRNENTLVHGIPGCYALTDYDPESNFFTFV